MEPNQIEKLLNEIQATEAVRHQRFESTISLLEQLITQVEADRKQAIDLMALLKQQIASLDSQTGRVEQVTAALIKIQIGQQSK
jgi:ABC-type transporter Mla subunit MlaD